MGLSPRPGSRRRMRSPSGMRSPWRWHRAGTRASSRATPKSAGAALPLWIGLARNYYKNLTLAPDRSMEKLYVYTSLPTIIQGGMGVAVSNWRLAHAVSSLGQLGVVSSTALDQVFARRLQEGDPGGFMRPGLDHFPFREMAERVWSEYFIPGGKPAYASYKKIPAFELNTPRPRQELCIVA